VSENVNITADVPESEAFQSLGADDMQDMGLDSPGPPGGSIVDQAPAGDQPMAEAAVDEVSELPAGPGGAAEMPMEEATAVTEGTLDHPEGETPGVKGPCLALMDAHLHTIDAALRNYQPTNGNLAVNTASTLQPREAMWKRLVEQSRQVVLTGAESRNQDNVDEICSGNMSRVPELSVLTLRSARCLAAAGPSGNAVAKEGLMSAGCAMLRKQAAMAVVLVACLFGSGLADDAGKTATLNRTLSDIAELSRSINQQIEEACALIDRLSEQRELLTHEINQERERHGIASFRQAVQINRIDYNLKLIQQLSAYIERLHGSAEYFRGANQLLNFYARQARDDLLMLKTLQDADISGLMNKFAAAKNEFEMVLNKPLLDASGPYPRSLEMTWNEILRK
jgi:hypothetical protein